jgi:integrase
MPNPSAQKAELRAWRKRHRWHPHQLRHNAATELRKEFGIEAARIILGHRSAAITEVYAEKDEQEAIEAITKVG